jgi:hypothetical protein
MENLRFQSCLTLLEERASRLFVSPLKTVRRKTRLYEKKFYRIGPRVTDMVK